MGKRRVRCLLELGINTVVGFDPRADRREEATERHGIATLDRLSDADIDAADAAFISVPPDVHGQYMRQCTARRRSYFVEASVLDEGFDRLQSDADAAGIVAAPSITMGFHPATIAIRECIRSGRIGRVTNFMYHMGHYLPDWHTYEKVSDFYVSNPVTGAAREIVPFELTWLVRCFGWPCGVNAVVAKTTGIPGAELIDDTYMLLLQFADHPGVLAVDVISRPPTRVLTIIGSHAQLRWDWNANEVRIFDPERHEWMAESYETGAAAEGYHQNIGEQMYVDETRTFLDACRGNGRFPNTLAEDAKVLAILRAAEASSESGQRVCLDA